MRAFDKFVTWLENLAMMLAAATLAIMVCVQTYNVILRYFFKAPVAWTYPFITNYLLEALFFLAISWTLRTGGHIQLDLFSQHFNKATSRAAGLLSNGIAFTLFLIIFWLGILRVMDAFAEGDISPDTLQWPLWTSYILVPIGSGIVCLRLFLRMITLTPVSERPD
jgi:TRAP-type C4-dicarboxylate transport system permease small subunit